MKATATQGSAKRLAKLSSPTQCRRADDAPLGEADIDAEEHRPDVEEQERDGEEGDEHIAGPVDVAGAAEPAALPMRGAWPSTASARRHSGAVAS